MLVSPHHLNQIIGETTVLKTDRVVKCAAEPLVIFVDVEQHWHAIVHRRQRIWAIILSRLARSATIDLAIALDSSSTSIGVQPN